LLNPATPEELAAVLGETASRKQTITLLGRSSKTAIAGPVPASDVTVTTANLKRVLSYEPRDLTISVEAGMPWSELTQMLAKDRQMVPLDPPYAGTATVGGVVASNSSGPRRRLYGTARDNVIGMKFATLEGKIVQSGGMVVKNVAGLDMGKLLIGSFGTLAAIAVVNFKLHPMPPVERHFLLIYDSLGEAFEATRKIRSSVLQPASLDVLNPAAATQLGLADFVVSVQAGGNAPTIERYARELGTLGSVQVADPGFASRLQEFTPDFLLMNPGGAVARISSTLSGLQGAIAELDAAVLARAGSGVGYACFVEADRAAEAIRGKTEAVLEFAPESRKAQLELWPEPAEDFAIMKKVKDLFDPDHLLNRGRFYRRI
jgi:glycolate dehydrogenase FAD-binding subunit